MSDSIHVDLSDLQPGASAEVTPAEALTFGHRRKVERAVQKAPDDQRLDVFHLRRIAALVRSWTVKDAAGNDAPHPSAITLEQLESIPSRVVARILRTVEAEWRKATGGDEPEDPNSPSASS